MQQRTIEHAYTQTISWRKHDLVDWALGEQIYSSEKKQPGVTRHFSYSFDAAITSADGQYALLYTKLGTKGLLLKNGEMLREINRSYYHAETYEYPAVFLVAENGRTYLVHCPQVYCQLEFEDVETGEIITGIAGRTPADFFHSRLEVSPDNKWLISKGWVWQPMDMVVAYHIPSCMENPLLLDTCSLRPDVTVEVNTAGFISNHEVLIGAIDGADLYDDEESAPLLPGQLAIWDLTTGSLSAVVTVNGPFGNLFPIDETYAWDFFRFPKVINYRTGEIIDQLEGFPASEQASSIIHHIKPQQIVYSKELDTVAVLTTDHKVGLFTR